MFYTYKKLTFRMIAKLFFDRALKNGPVKKEQEFVEDIEEIPKLLKKLEN